MFFSMCYLISTNPHQAFHQIEMSQGSNLDSDGLKFDRSRHGVLGGLLRLGVVCSGSKFQAADSYDRIQIRVV
jgi:hypothetical protein